jgi:hypothetical protein
MHGSSEPIIYTLIGEIAGGRHIIRPIVHKSSGGFATVGAVGVVGTVTLQYNGTPAVSWINDCAIALCYWNFHAKPCFGLWGGGNVLVEKFVIASSSVAKNS